MDLFTSTTTENLPLAEQLRPQSFEDIFLPKRLQQRVPLLLKKLETTGLLPNLILWGPPGTGKTSFALLLAKKTKGEFISINAIDTGAKKLKELGETARRNRIELNLTTILFIDEIHRLNKAQQDVLLPYTEKADFILIGATTENPSYELNSALLSRSQVLVFEPLTKADLLQISLNALKKAELSKEQVFSENAFDALIEIFSGDARKTINALEQIIEIYALNEGSYDFPLSVESLESIFQSPTLKYDKSSDEHYNCISAFIKSIRGSDADAGLYYLARMIVSGEDPKFIARRLIILASEDVGNADPKALGVAVSGLQAVEAVGLPEAGINLAQVVCYLASAPKSNRSYLGYKKALDSVKNHGSLPIPLSLRSSQTPLNRSQGYGKDYTYTHDQPKGWAEQQYLPDKIKGSKFYDPSKHGFEKTILNYSNWLKSSTSTSSPDSQS